MKINLVVCVLLYGPSVWLSMGASLRSLFVVSFSMGLFLFTKGKFLTNSFIQSKVNIIYSDISWASSIKTYPILDNSFLPLLILYIRIY